MAQPEVLLHLRYAIDTAIAYPTKPNTETAINLVASHPRAMRSSHIRQNLGVRRWAWLNEHGIYEVRGDITPDIVK
jgi:hypothetical protein